MTQDQYDVPAAVADLLAGIAGQPPLLDLPLEVARERYLTAGHDRHAPDAAHAACHRHDLEIDDSGIRAALYEPAGAAGAPPILFLHGGGFVVGGIDSHDWAARLLAVETGAPVLLPEYRLAPEHPFPAALQDSLRAARWLAERSDLAPAGRIAVAGDSAGGNLAAACCLDARRQGPVIAGQLLWYPMLDVRADTPSMTEFAEGWGLSATEVRHFWQAYRGAAAPVPTLSPALAGSLAGLPPAVVVTAEFDPLRDEGERYARALARAGVEVRLERVRGHLHGFLDYAAAEAGALQAARRSCRHFCDLITGRRSGP